ncbi:glycerophosphoryl diester phosphodiesterase : Glycerophosphoryl diester phosphodiesterase OS=Singulisphaera acidiphila (strain ATCC BAA-1392 / DSM 18658 / VKM B-2454 / MOB10) GN=Sinac_5378 PE=4 SV=1: GDPD [Gemmataceae bacterium]|nr:glycerophosphoryl diester phosphodiesterase : Glycerophosphoryl diester phosphodiesterase OS=Singulisphaera acidiphila (strain ATCC BAA-1392 / DSM 18658 / VKM B-2454 / MOB10) GN=Sinac_5378 PE=4 SV=1: GDPD [Gemmataceae bacterium]VTT96642.1 glycerophosphoryl diester phosphodiesterase : Glycerophosphoryl diester phosphodiesterase OS=Singulisphaera acidiphila (strain ATCC BAA-1392 / DSM 18658 / VKM B-2454 / MOB10) GN=Sinac_5378 PE=4 SV=1: GDPD [Gemmataceae bacterium]
MLRTVAALLCLAAPAAWAADKPVAIVAHRGASHDAPENTVASFKLAWEQKADAGELDVFITKDGKLVVCHDRNTKRLAGVSKIIPDTTFEELRALDVGKWKGEKFAGEKIPTLAEMLATVPEGKLVFIELKCGAEAVPELDRVLQASKLRPAQTPIISFSADVVAAVKKARPDLPAYWIVELLPKKGAKPPAAADLVAKAKEIKADGLDLSADAALDEPLVKAVRDAGLKLYVWTVNDADVARRMVKFGVDGITTDRPGWLREQLAK